MDQVQKIATTVLYEGYLLWPYRRSALKNRQRWTFGGGYPRAFSEANRDSDPWRMQTQCLVTGSAPVVSISVRFLHLVERQVVRANPDGSLTDVDELRVGDERYLTWEEATERTIDVGRICLAHGAEPLSISIVIDAGHTDERLPGPGGAVAGVLRRSWQALRGEIVVRVEQLPARDGLFRLTVLITNTAAWDGEDRETTLKQTFVSTHTALEVSDGAFVSLTDPPAELAADAEACVNIKTWPVLVGEEGDLRRLLSSPIIMCDYPEIAPESGGDFYDASEIDQLLTLNVLSLTDEEKAEMRASDPRARAILERSEALTKDDFMRMHGVIREFRMLGSEDEINPLFSDLERPAPSSIEIDGVEVRTGSRVLLRPRSGADIMDLALAGKIAVVQAIEQDYEERLHIAVALEDDPGMDLGMQGLPGHRFFFGVDELEPLEAESREDA